MDATAVDVAQGAFSVLVGGARLEQRCLGDAWKPRIARVVSQRGEGSRFIVELPRLTAAEGTEA